MITFVKKIMSILICVILIVSLCSCGNNKDKSNKETTDATKTSDGTKEYKYSGKAPISNERVKISVLTANYASKRLGFDEMSWWQEALKRANVELVMEEIDHSSYKDVVRPRLAAAVDLPDIVLLDGRDNDMSYINSGIFIELTEYYDKYGYNIRKQFDNNKGLKAELTTPDGKIYYLPYIYATNNISRCLMINTGYIDALGMKINDIKTTDDFYNYLVAVKSADLNGNGDKSDEVPLFMRSNMVQLWGMYWGLDLVDTGGYQVKDDGKVICGYADERYLDCLKYLNKLYKEELLYSEFATANLDIQNALFSNNRIGSLIHFISNCTKYSQSINESWDFFNDAPIMLPLNPPLKGPYGDQYVYGRDALGGRVFGITKNCKDPDAVFCFIDYLYSQEVGELTWCGIEGTDYNKANGEIVFIGEYLKNPDYRSINGRNFDGLPSYQLSDAIIGQQCKAVREASSALDKYVMNPSITFSYKLKEENEILQAYSADLKTYFSENLIAFIMGTRPLSEWENYLAEMEKTHLSDVIEVYQASVDRAASVK